MFSFLECRDWLGWVVAYWFGVGVIVRGVYVALYLRSSLDFVFSVCDLIVWGLFGYFCPLLFICIGTWVLDCWVSFVWMVRFGISVDTSFGLGGFLFSGFVLFGLYVSLFGFLWVLLLDVSGFEFYVGLG